MDAIIEIGQAFLDTPQGGNILKKIADFKGTKEEFDAKKEELKKLISIKVQAYTIKGNVTNALTSEPLPGVEVKPVFALFPIKKEKYEKKVVTKEIVVDEDPESENFMQPILKRDGSSKTKRVVKKIEDERWVKDEGDNFVKTDKNGNYEFKIGLPTIYENKDRPDSSKERALGVPLLTFNKSDGFAPSAATIINGNGTVKGTLAPVKLIDIDKAAERANEEIQALLNNISVEQAIAVGLDAVSKALQAAKNLVLKFVKIIQTKLFPLAISLMVIFGFTKLAQADQAKCPSNALIKLAIKRRNSVVRQLNQMWAVVAANVALTIIFLQLQVIFKQAKFSISNLPLPLGAPLGVGLPYNLVSKLQGIEKLFEELSDANKEIRKALIIAMVFLLASIVLIVIYLKKIDELINKCVADKIAAGNLGDGDGDDDGLSMTQINAEILALTVNEEENQGQEPLKIVNGFTLAVVVDRSEQVGETYRRYATATNSKGVVILKGEPSFSAIDQILLDELAFYIVNNNLKAD
jgi:hypothetical protein